MSALRRVPRRGVVVIGVVVVLALTATAAYAVFAVTTGNAGNSYGAGTVSLSDNDSGTALLSLSNAGTEATDAGCIRVASAGSLDSDVRLYGSTSGTARDHLTLTVTRGTDASPSFDSCAGFTADARDYYGDGNGVIWKGKLSRFPTSYAEGKADISTAAAAGYGQVIQDAPGIVGFYRMQESSGTAFTPFTHTVSATVLGTAGTYNNGATPGGTGLPVFNTPPAFDGTDDHVAVTDSDFALGANGSVAAWVKWDATGGTGDHGLGGDTGNAWQLPYVNGSTLSYRVGGTTVNTTIPANQLRDTQWHYVAVTKSGATARLYIDGVEVNSTGSIGATTAATSWTFMKKGGAASYAKGSIDEIVISTEALTQAQLMTYYDAQAVKEAWSNGETHSYRFDITVDADAPASAAGTSANASFTWEARNR
ncbi:MAG: LamG domain-containing protein [Solirubrobacteraceae bacterium]|nr:LamG domain-containing protein [Solirubrobacteraceae bacterium]